LQRDRRINESLGIRPPGRPVAHHNLPVAEGALPADGSFSPADDGLTVEYSRSERWVRADGRTQLLHVVERHTTFLVDRFPRRFAPALRLSSPFGHRRGWSILFLFFPAVVLAVGVAVAAFVLRDRGQSPQRSVTVALPAPVVASSSANRSAGQKAAPRASRPITKAAALSRPPAEAADAGSQIETERRTQMEDALAVAFTTDEPQPWSANGRSGWVVVGPAQANAGAACRDVAILTREEGLPDQTVHERRCRARDGSIRSQPNS
jgi:surface antigen